MTSPDPLAEFRTLPEDVRGLTAAVTAQGRFGKANRLRIKILAAVCVGFLILSGVVVRILIVQDCAADRSSALSGPANQRVSFVIDAFRASALDANATLPEDERDDVIAELAANRERFPVIPSDKELAKAPASQLLIYLDVIRALDADDDYQAAVAAHPVCSFWGV